LLKNLWQGNRGQAHKPHAHYRSPDLRSVHVQRRKLQGHLVKLTINGTNT